MNNRLKLRYLILDKQLQEQYEIVDYKNNRYLLRHKLLDNSTKEYLSLLHAGGLLLTLFKKIEILPSLNEMDVAYRNKVMPGTKSNKNPDYRIDGKFWELMQPTYPYNYKKIDQRIRKGYQQANHLILYFENPVNGFTVQKAINDRMQINRELAEVIIIVKGSIISHIKRKPGK